MSATNRGAIRSTNDFYPTPASAVLPLFRRWPTLCGGHILEPCAGTGAIIDAVCNAGLTNPKQWIGWDLRKDLPDHPRVCPGIDFLVQNNHGGPFFNLACTNPPYSLTLEILAKGLEWAPKVALLLRLNFLGSLKRSEFWRENMPAWIGVLSERPKMALNKKGKPGTDATEYAWLLWDRTKRSEATIEVLQCGDGSKKKFSGDLTSTSADRAT